MKKNIVFLFILLVAMFFSMPAFANESKDLELNNAFGVTVKSEKDIYIEWIKATNEELKLQGYTEQQIQKIRDINLEKVFFEYSLMSSDELRGIGFDANQISLLRSYKGEPITEESAVLDVLASNDLTTWYIGSAEYPCNNTRMGVRYNWRWDDMPIVVATDMVVLAWKAVDTNMGYPDGSVVTANNATRGHLRYANQYTESIVSESDVDVTVNHVDNTVSVTFPMEGSNVTYAKSGYIQLVLNANNFTFDSLLLGGSYGHRTVSFTGDISYTKGGDLSITFYPALSVSTIESPQAKAYPNGEVD